MDLTEHLKEHAEITRRSVGSTERLLELVHEVNNLATRLHMLEDFFVHDGIIDGLIQITGHLVIELERLRHERPSSDAQRTAGSRNE